MPKRLSISLPRIEAEEVVPFATKDAKGYMMKEVDGSVTVIVSAKNYVRLFDLMARMFGWMTRFLSE